MCDKLHTRRRSRRRPALPGLTASKGIGYISTMAFKELDVVRIVALHAARRPYDGTPGVSREPRVGDVGTVVYVYSAPGEEPVFSVEAPAPDGQTLWAADFAANELGPAGGSV